MTKETDAPLVLVKNFPTRALGEAGLAFLQRHNILAILQGSDFAGTGMAQGFDLYVQAKDVDEARGMLERLYDGV